MREVVVGVDGSQAATLAVDRALDEAERSGRPLRVLHAWTLPVWTGGVPGVSYEVLAPPADCARLASDLTEELVLKGLARRPSDVPVDVTPAVAEGPAGQVLVRAAEDAGLLVVGGRQHRRLAGVLLGSTTQHVLHHARCPVMVVPETVSRVHGARRVVVGVDGSEGSRAALRWGADAARRHGCPLVAVRAWLLTDLPGAISLSLPPASDAYDTAVLDWLRAEARAALDGAVPPGLELEAAYGAPSRVLLERTGSDDLLVVGARGHGGFLELLLGSVAAQCTQHARGTVVVVRPHEERLEQ